MRKSKFIHCIDSHTAGEPTRLVIDGLPVIKGNNLKKSYLTYSVTKPFFQTLPFTLCLKTKSIKTRTFYLRCI